MRGVGGIKEEGYMLWSELKRQVEEKLKEMKEDDMEVVAYDNDCCGGCHGPYLSSLIEVGLTFTIPNQISLKGR